MYTYFGLDRKVRLFFYKQFISFAKVLEIWNLFSHCKSEHVVIDSILYILRRIVYSSGFSTSSVLSILRKSEELLEQSFSVVQKFLF